MENKKLIHKTFFKQQGESDCGVACLFSIIQYYGGYNSLENLRKLSGTSITGTTLLGLYQAANATGFAAEGCEADMAALINHQQPCILHVVIDKQLQHYVVCYGITSPPPPLQKRGEQNDEAARFIIGDPAKGIIYLTRNELNQIWQSKTCLTLTPDNHFKKAADIKQQKKQWIINLIKTDLPLLGIAAGLGIAIAALGLVMVIFSQRLIDDILPKQNFTKLNLGIALVFLLLLIKEGLSYLRQYFLLRQSKDFNNRIIDFFYRHLLQLPKPFFDTRKIGELTARLNDTSRIQKVISQLAGNAVIDALMAIVATVFIFVYSWQTGIACLVFMPLFFLLIYRYNKQILNGQRNIMSSYAQTESNYISTLQGIEPIKNYNKQNLFQQTNQSIYNNYQNKIFSLGKIQISLSFVANAFAVVFLISVLAWSSYQVLYHHLKTGELMAILGMAGSLLPSVANLALVSIPVNEAKIAFDRMFEFTGIEPEKNKDEPEINLFEKLQVQHLAFRFAGRSQILKDISFEVNKGEIIAIMGENGCGKSTLTQILQKHYQQEGGNISINQHISFNNIPIKNLRNIIGVVPQNIHIFNGTVIENIAFDDAQKHTQTVINFLQESGFMQFIDGLPQSLMTIVGEEGINLSGGQKQIIALARALYHQPQLLILDEATAAMDKQSEQFVLRLLQQLKQKMGIIFITHRLHVLKNFCDRIYILENGIIAQQGTHEHLLQTQNLYSSYWNELIKN